MYTFRVISKEFTDTMKNRLRSSCNKAALVSLYNEFKTVCTEPYFIEDQGKKLSLEEYISPKKIYAFNTDEILSLVTLFFCDPEAFPKYLKSLPHPYQELIKRLLVNKYESYTFLKAIGLGSCIAVKESRYGYDNTMTIAQHSVWFEENSAYSRKGDYCYDREWFFSLDKRFAWLLSLYMLSEEDRNPFKDKLPEGLTLMDAENEAQVSYPLICGFIKQNVLKFSAFKVTQASSWKVMRQLPLPDVIPDYPENDQKFNLGQILFPIVNFSLNRNNQSFLETARLAYRNLMTFPMSALIPSFLPSIKGFRVKALEDYSRSTVRNLVKDVLVESGGKWIDVQAMMAEMTLHCDTILLRGLDNMDLEDLCFGEYITPDRLSSHIERPLIQAFFAFLYGIGGMSLACDMSEAEFGATPWEHIKYARLNNLGRYIIGLTDEYQPTRTVAPKALFDLDDRHLIIRTLDPGNPYERLLDDTAESMGGNRYRMSPESFLAKCKTKKDVDEKVAFFKDYICRDLPKNWSDFFDTIARRCNPFSSDNEKYVLYKLDPSDRDLAMLISTDEVLRNIVIKAEGFRILVPCTSSSTFKSRLKQFGYLV